MQEKLRRWAASAPSITVDITNYLLSCWNTVSRCTPSIRQQLEAGNWWCRRAKADEPMTLLDGNEVKLSEETTLVIADAQGPAWPAGIFGGDRTGVSETATDILLGRLLRATLHHRSYPCLRGGLHTDSSHRFERWGWILESRPRRWTGPPGLLLDICGGEAGPVIEVKSEAHLPVGHPHPVCLHQARQR